MTHWQEMGELRNEIARLKMLLTEISKLPSGEWGDEGVWILNGHSRAVALAKLGLDTPAKV